MMSHPPRKFEITPAIVAAAYLSDFHIFI